MAGVLSASQALLTSPLAPCVGGAAVLTTTYSRSGKCVCVCVRVDMSLLFSLRGRCFVGSSVVC